MDYVIRKAQRAANLDASLGESPSLQRAAWWVGALQLSVVEIGVFALAYWQAVRQ